MTRLAFAVAGVFALIFGAALLLFVLPGASVHHPSVTGLTYWLAVLTRAFGPGTVRLTLLGLGLIVGGIALNLQVAWPKAADVQVGWRHRVLLFCGLVGLLSLALLLMLVGVTFVTLGAE